MLRFRVLGISRLVEELGLSEIATYIVNDLSERWKAGNRSEDPIHRGFLLLTWF